MMEEIKKAIEAVQALNLYNGDEICSSLIQGVINKHVAFLNWRQQEIIDRLPTIGKWVTIYRKNQGEGYLDFEKWRIVDRKTFHDFVMENYDVCKNFNLPRLYRHKRLVTLSVERDTFHHGAETLRGFELARLKFVEDWLAKN